VNPPRTVTQPGECVSVDTLESPTPGLVAQAKGTLTNGRYNYATVFVDQYSGLDYVHLHRTNSGDEILAAKLAFEQFALTHGVRIQHYHADNGRFAEAKFQQSVLSSKQGLTFCGVNTHHQNGRAERRIRHLTEAARTMILHAAHRWPQVITPHLWPYAIRLASDIGRNISQDSKEGEKKAKAPIQLFSRVPVKVQLKTYHPFGCPTYVLHDTLANGKYHPKWSDRTRVGVYLGHSNQHASTVALVLNVNTGHVSPVFHCVFDDHFDCVPTDRFVQSKWQELAKLLDKDAPNVQDYGQEENIPKGLKAPWYSSKTAAHKADNHRHNKETATRSSDEPPKKRARFVLNETREPEAQEAPIHTRSGRTIHQPR
jgi:hypothetical protein